MQIFIEPNRVLSCQFYAALGWNIQLLLSKTD
jgi:hypothetical protein